MKKNTVLKILFTVLIYIFSMGICEAIIMYVPYLGHTKYSRSITREMAQEFASGVPVSEIDNHTYGILAYDTGGNCIAQLMPDNTSISASAKDVFNGSVSQSLGPVISGKTIERVMISVKYGIGAFVCGQPLYKDGRIAGAFFTIKQLRDLYPTAVCFFFVYTLMFIIVAIIFFSALRRRQQYMQMEREYVANISHDLKSPLASVRALVETMSHHYPMDELEHKKYCDFILRESFGLEQTVSSILELSALQSATGHPEKRQTQLSEIVTPTIEKYKVLYDDMDIRFTIDPELSSPCTVNTNSKQIARLLDILMNNSMKFVGDDGWIRLHLTKEAKYVTISVEDNGIGISEDDQKKVFERFFMVSQDRRIKGSGLGLSIAREITTSLGERIWVKSELGKGATFFFTVHY